MTVVLLLILLGGQAVWAWHNRLPGACGYDHRALHSVGRDQTKAEDFSCGSFHCMVSDFLYL